MGRSSWRALRAFEKEWSKQRRGRRSKWSKLKALAKVVLKNHNGHGSTWTVDEDRLLEHVVARCRPRRWSKIHRRLWAGKRSLSAIKQHWYLLEELDDGDEGDLDESGEDQVDEVDREEKVDEDLAVGGEEEVDEDRFRETLHGITVFVDTPILRRASELASLLAEQDRVFLASWDKVFCRKAVHVDRGLELRSGTQRSDIVLNGAAPAVDRFPRLAALTHQARAVFGPSLRHNDKYMPSLWKVVRKGTRVAKKAKEESAGQVRVQQTRCRHMALRAQIVFVAVMLNEMVVYPHLFPTLPWVP